MPTEQEIKDQIQKLLSQLPSGVLGWETVDAPDGACTQRVNRTWATAENGDVTPVDTPVAIVKEGDPFYVVTLFHAGPEQWRIPAHGMAHGQKVADYLLKDWGVIP